MTTYSRSQSTPLALNLLCLIYFLRYSLLLLDIDVSISKYTHNINELKLTIKSIVIVQAKLCVCQDKSVKEGAPVVGLQSNLVGCLSDPS